MFGKYNGFDSKARVSACMYFLVKMITRLSAKHIEWGITEWVEIWCHTGFNFWTKSMKTNIFNFCTTDLHIVVFEIMQKS
jgi:hypothetical protein